MIKTITSWRGILALVVVLFHYHVPVFYYLVRFAVSFFFVLSGFLLARRYSQQPLPLWNQFFVGRAIRLYVANWVALVPIVAIMLIYHCWEGTPQFFAHVALVQSYIPSKEVYFTFNSIGWFLCALLLAYACFPWLMRNLSRISLRTKLCAMAVLIVLLLVVMPFLSTLVRVHIYVNPFMRLADFVLGMILADVLQRIQAKWQTPTFLGATALELMAIALIAIGALCVAYVPFVEHYSDFVWWYIPVAVLILVSVLLNGHEGVVGRFLTCKPLMWLGGLSLEIYILQMGAARLYNYFVAPVLGHFGVVNAYDLYPIFGTLLLIVLAWLMHRFIMLPVRRWVAPMIK